MTTHFEGKFKGKFQAVPRCKTWAMRPMYGDMTTDQTKVDCKACAKKLGITPAAKPEAKNKTGTCQCCFHGQKVSKGGGTLLSLHGYERPGHGYILGRCRGEAELPYEVSCERTKYFRTELEQILASKEEYLGKLERQEFETLNDSYTIEVKDENGKPVLRVGGSFAGKRFIGRYETKNISLVLVKGAAPIDVEGRYGRQTFSYEKTREDEMRATTRTIEAIKSNIAFLTGKINEWKKVW